MSDTPSGYTLVTGDFSPAFARRILAAAAAAGIDAKLVKPVPERGGYYVPSAMAAAVATTADPGASFGGTEGDLLAELRAEVSATYSTLLTPTSTYTWNTDGTIATETLGGVTTTFAWNGDGTLHTETRNGVTRTYAYNGDGTLASVA